MKVYSLITLTAACVAFCVAGPGPSAAAASPQACTKCAMQAIISYPTDSPSCYAGTTLSIQGVADGVCASACTPNEACEYSISIRMDSNPGTTCDMAIFTPVTSSCGAGQATSCGACTTLAWSHVADPETVECVAQGASGTHRSECYEARVCNTGVACGSGVVTKVEFKCSKCSS